MVQQCVSFNLSETTCEDIIRPDNIQNLRVFDKPLPEIYFFFLIVANIIGIQVILFRICALFLQFSVGVVAVSKIMCVFSEDFCMIYFNYIILTQSSNQGHLNVVVYISLALNLMSAGMKLANIKVLLIIKFGSGGESRAREVGSGWAWEMAPDPIKGYWVDRKNWRKSCPVILYGIIFLVPLEVIDMITDMIVLEEVNTDDVVKNIVVFGQNLGTIYKIFVIAGFILGCIQIIYRCLPMISLLFFKNESPPEIAEIYDDIPVTKCDDFGFEELSLPPTPWKNFTICLAFMCDPSISLGQKFICFIY